jgi:hypothetical protein
MKNKSFRTTAEYVLEKEGAYLLETNMLGETHEQMSREIAAIRRYRPQLEKAILHATFSLPYRENEDGTISHEELDDERFVELVNKWRDAMEATNTLYFIARHTDTEHNHVHLVASRIRKDGSVVDDSWDYRRSEVVVRQLEKEFGLEPTPCSNSRVAFRVEKEFGIEAKESARRAQTQKQKHHSSGKPPVTQLLADAIDEATADHPTMTQLIGRLMHQGIVVKPTFSSKGLFREALAFEMDGVKVAGNKLGSAYSFPGLQRKRGVSYDPERDMPAIEAAAAGQRVEPHESDIDNTQYQNAADSNAEAAASDDKQTEQLTLQFGEGRGQWGSILPDSTNSTAPKLAIAPTPTPTPPPAQAASLTPTPTPAPAIEQNHLPPQSEQQLRLGGVIFGNGFTSRLQLPEDTQALRAYLDKIYQQFATQIREQTDLRQIEDVDVGVALLGLLEGLEADDIRRVLLRSPKGQYFKQLGSPIEEFSEYTKERVAIAFTYRQLKNDPSQQERVERVKPIVEEFFKAVKDGQQLRGTNYTLRREGDTRSVIANDGRGEVLRLTGRWVEKASLTDDDFRLMQLAQTLQLAKKQHKSQQRPISPSGGLQL